MRGDEQYQEEMFSYGSLSQRVPLDHPLRRVRAMADEAMGCLETRFEQMYSKMGRPSVPPEQLLRALLLQMLYSVRSERMLVEEMEYNLLFRWFVGLRMNDRVWDATSFSKNRERLLSGEVAQVFFSAVATDVTTCSPAQERVAAIRMMRRLKQTMKPKIVAADKGYHEQDFVGAMREMGVAAHVPRYKCRRPCLVDPALYDRADYIQSQKRRKWVERFFGWMKTTANLAKTRHRGHRKLHWNFTLAAAAYNLVRMANLTAAN